MTLAEFIQKYVKTKVDFDKAYGCQCVDLFRQYYTDVLGIKEHTGPVEGAKDIYLNYPTMPKERKYFVRLMDSAKVKPGDIAVWGSTPTNKFGHVAIVITEINSTSLLVLEQNGFTQDGAKIVERSKTNLLGFLRAKDGNK